MLQLTHAMALRSRRRRTRALDISDPERQRQAELAIGLAVSRVFGVADGALWRQGRGVRAISSARQVGMYIAHVCCGMSLTKVGQMFDRDRTTVAYGCLKIEIRRDEPAFDQALDLIAGALPTLVKRGTASSQAARQQ